MEGTARHVRGRRSLHKALNALLRIAGVSEGHGSEVETKGPAGQQGRATLQLSTRGDDLRGKERQEEGMRLTSLSFISEGRKQEARNEREEPGGTAAMRLWVCEGAVLEIATRDLSDGTLL